jgi:hypothetical protein
MSTNLETAITKALKIANKVLKHNAMVITQERAKAFGETNCPWCKKIKEILRQNPETYAIVDKVSFHLMGIYE